MLLLDKMCAIAMRWLAVPWADQSQQEICNADNNKNDDQNKKIKQRYLLDVSVRPDVYHSHEAVGSTIGRSTTVGNMQ